MTMTAAMNRLYPLVLLSDADGNKGPATPVDGIWRDYLARNPGWTAALEPRRDESALSPERCAEIEAVYATFSVE